FPPDLKLPELIGQVKLDTARAIAEETHLARHAMRHAAAHVLIADIWKLREMLVNVEAQMQKRIQQLKQSLGEMISDDTAESPRGEALAALNTLVEALQQMIGEEASE